MDTAPAAAPALARSRWDVIDLARGVAILAMIVYHFGWDLSFPAAHRDKSYRAAGMAVVCRASSQARSCSCQESGWSWRIATPSGGGRFLRRLATIGGAALLVTIATYFAFPDSYIFFGILHCIALSSILALPFLRAPVPVTLGVAAFVLAAPWIFTSPALDAP